MNRKIIALTTDPYDNIYGYSLVFMRLFDFIQHNQKLIEVILISNDGISSKKLNNPTFQKIKLDSHSNIISKTIILGYNFFKRAVHYPNDSIIIANCEIPELLAALCLKIKFKHVFCVIQDTRVRDGSLKTKFVCNLRVFLLNRINNVIFTNKFTLNTYKGNVNKFYIGNPVFA